MKQSNEYAKTVMGAEKYDKWAKMMVDELKAFLGFIILMGINHLPSLNDYWSRDPASDTLQWQIAYHETGSASCDDIYTL